MGTLEGQFVLVRTIGEALKNAREDREKGYRFSFDMLGEAAYTMHDARRYYDAYRTALVAIGSDQPNDAAAIFERPSISVKLSALHPRYEWFKHARMMTELLPALIALAKQARDSNIGFTIDAEESERLDLMLDIFQTMGEAESLRSWDGLGLAVQGYSKRGLPVIEWLCDLARKQDRRIPVRLVKGAYWDTEIKRAQ